jgi:hypothetical protein
MLILLPVILMSLTALVLLVLRLIRPKFKYPWTLAAGGVLLALGSVFLWRIQFPHSSSLPSGQLALPFSYKITWLADSISWPYALALASLTAAVIWTSVVRAEPKSMPWTGILIISGLGILAVAAENPLTLLLTWTAIDIFELITMVRFTGTKDHAEGIIFTFVTRLAGTGFVLWANMVSIAAGTPLDFRSAPSSAGIYLLIAAVFRLGVFPLNLPYHKDNFDRRGFGTMLTLVSAASSLAMLARLPATALKSPITPYLLILAAVAALSAGWMWLRSSDEILGRPFWISGIASLAIVQSLRGNPTGSTGWGVTMILCGGALFLFSARQRRVLWLPLFSLWAFSTLPFSLTSSSWQIGSTSSGLFVIPYLPAQALFMAGLFLHAIRPGEIKLESQLKWVKAIYPIGLLFLVASSLLLGIWGWAGARTIGLWWWAILTILLAIGFTFLALKLKDRIPPGKINAQWMRVFRTEWVFQILTPLYNFLRRLTDAVTTALEGEGGLLWSLLLLILVLSILSTRVR